MVLSVSRYFNPVWVSFIYVLEHLRDLFDKWRTLLYLTLTEILLYAAPKLVAMEDALLWAKVAAHPPKYVIASLIVSLGGLINGIDTGTIGPVISMPYFTKQFGQLTPSVQGLVVSSLMLSASITCFFAGDLSDSLGRPRAIAIGALVFSVGAALETSAMDLAMLITGRLILGAGEGLFLSTLIVYTTEISPPRWRGALCTTVQLFTTLGLVAGFFIAYGTVNIPSTLSWRLPFAVHAAIGLVLVISSCFYLPHSPRWLTYRGRREVAAKTWDDLGVSSAEREKDYLENPALNAPGSPTVDVPVAANMAGSRTLREKLVSFMSVFAAKSRKATILGIFVVSMQQLSGIDGLLYYSPLLFHQAGLSSASANFLASGVSAICIFVFTILSVVYADKWGRRPSTIYGGAVLLTCMGLMGILYASNSVHSDSGAARWIVIASIYVFAIVYSMTWAICMRIFASEIQPIATRATALSLAQGANCLTNWFVAFVTPVLLAKSSYAIYILFSVSLALTIIVSLIYMPETNGKDLESVTDVFANHKSEFGLVIKLRRSARKLSTGARAIMRRRPWGHATEDQSIELEERHC